MFYLAMLWHRHRILVLNEMRRLLFKGLGRNWLWPISKEGLMKTDIRTGNVKHTTFCGKLSLGRNSACNYALAAWVYRIQ